MKQANRKLTLHQPAAYQIKVLGYLDEHWSDWIGGLTITVENDDEDAPLTALTVTVDQAALQSLLRRLFSLGLPLISVIWVER